jgi:uncharacterized protein YcbK (DUF882 family)
VAEHGEHAVIADRRTVLAGLGAFFLVRPALATGGEPRELRLYNPNTDERFVDVYHDGAVPIANARRRLDWFLRDHHLDQWMEMDAALLDLLWRLQQRYLAVHGRRVTVNVHSAFRTEETNARLIPEGAAQNSFHKTGKAVDVTVQGLGIHFLAGRVREIGAGGIGIYWRHRFVHMDTGPRRFWYRRV